jgi:hypothetical protein
MQLNQYRRQSGRKGGTTMNQITLNEIFEKVKTFFREEPLRFNMDVWCNLSLVPNVLTPPCKTVGCLAFGIIEATGQKHPYHQTFAEAARQTLGIDESVSDKLFYVENWPQPYRNDYQISTTDYIRHRYNAMQEDQYSLAVCKYLKSRMVETLCDRLDHFLSFEAPADA